jgi:hypothetical protein
MTGSYAYALDLCEKVIGKGIYATCDPRSVTPPCVLFSPPAWTFSGVCNASGDWRIYALAPAIGNADAWKALDEIVLTVNDVLPLQRADFVQYPLSPDSQPFPAYELTFTEGFPI